MTGVPASQVAGLEPAVGVDEAQLTAPSRLESTADAITTGIDGTIGRGEAATGLATTVAAATVQMIGAGIGIALVMGPRQRRAATVATSTAPEIGLESLARSGRRRRAETTLALSTALATGIATMAAATVGVQGVTMPATESALA